MKKIKSEPLTNGDTAVEGFDELFSTAPESLGIWAEPQLYLLPFCVPQDHAKDRFRSIKISETVKINDEVRHRSFKVNPDPELGLPGSFDLEVMTGIYGLADAELRKYGSVTDYINLGSFRSFLELIGKPYSGKYARMLKESLRRLAATTCISEGFFYSKPRDLYLVESFTFITGVEILGEADFNGKVYNSTRIKLHEFIRENLNSNFRTLIDLEYFRSLKTSIAKPISLHMSYRTFKNGKCSWDVDYSWLAQRLAIKVHSDFKRAKEQMKPALNELKETGFLYSWEWLEGRKLRLIAGDLLLEKHKARVTARDSWETYQKEKQTSVVNLVPRTEKEAMRVKNHDVLAPLCTEYSVRGWLSIAHKAAKKGLTEESLKQEALKRGHQLPSD